MINILKEYKGNPSWSLAGLFIHDDIWLSLFDCFKENNIINPIHHVFGSISSALEGGRVGLTGCDEYNGILITQEYNNLNIGCRLTLSNHLITKDMVKQENNLNSLLSVLNKNNKELTYKNGVIVANDNIAAYIKEKYPNLQLINSVIRPAIDVGWGKETVEYYNHFLNIYDLVVISTGKALDDTFVKELKHKKKIEVIVNSRCALNCQLAAEHYNNIANEALKKGNNVSEIDKVNNKCYEIRKNNLFIGSNLTVEQVQHLLNLGITNFKLEGREWQDGVLLRDLGDYIFDNKMLLRLYRNYFNLSI